MKGNAGEKPDVYTTRTVQCLSEYTAFLPGKERERNALASGKKRKEEILARRGSGEKRRPSKHEPQGNHIYWEEGEKEGYP